MSEANSTKTCCRCRKTKLVTEFSKRKGVIDGRRSHCKKCVYEYDANYRKKNKRRFTYDPVRALAYRKANMVKIAARHKDYCETNKETIKKIRDKYRSTPKGRLANCRKLAKRRSIKCGAVIGDIKLITAWEKTWRTAKAVPCHWCGKKSPGKYCHSDHRIPLSKGGAHDVENLVVACQECNGKKHAKMPDVFNSTMEQPLLFW